MWPAGSVSQAVGLTCIHESREQGEQVRPWADGYECGDSIRWEAVRGLFHALTDMSENCEEVRRNCPVLVVICAIVRDKLVAELLLMTLSVAWGVS